MQEFYKKYSFIINLSLAIVVICAAIALVFYLVQRPPAQEEVRFTGGSGEPVSPRISILGWDNQDQYGAKLSIIMDLRSQQRVASHIETDYLSRHKDTDLLTNGTIANISSDNSNGTTEFRVTLPKQSYRAVYNINTSSVVIEEVAP